MKSMTLFIGAFVFGINLNSSLVESQEFIASENMRSNALACGG